MSVGITSVPNNTPIGGVIAWLKDLSGVSSLSGNWAECNGQTISDGQSPLNGVTLPDLNGSSGDQTFLRGNTSSGSTGGSDTHNHSIGSHTHNFTISDITATTPLPTLQYVDTGTTNSRDTFNDTDTYALSGTTDGATGTTSTEDNIPTYYEVVWIIRIK